MITCVCGFHLCLLYTLYTRCYIDMLQTVQKNWYSVVVHVLLLWLWLWLCVPPFNGWYQQLVLRVYSEMVLLTRIQSHSEIYECFQYSVRPLAPSLRTPPFLYPMWYIGFKSVHLWQQSIVWEASVDGRSAWIPECWFLCIIPYFRVIRHISLISAYLPISAYCLVGLNTRC